MTNNSIVFEVQKIQLDLENVEKFRSNNLSLPQNVSVSDSNMSRASSSTIVLASQNIRITSLFVILSTISSSFVFNTTI